MKYAVAVTETLLRTVVVEASNENEAIDKVQAAYDEEKIVLDYDDYDGEMEIICNGTIREEDVAYYQILGEEE